MNNFCGSGNLTKDPELRYTTGENQMAVCNLNIAINDGYGEKQTTTYLPIVVFGRLAENCDRYLAKGSKINVVGRIQTRNYTNKEGTRVYVTEIVAANIEFLSRKGDQKATSGGAGEAPAQQQNQQPPQGPPDGFTEMADDDIPF